MTKKKNNKQIQPRRDQAGKLVRVKFSHSAASAVAIAGTFNDWRPDATPMTAMGEGQWLKDLVLAPGTYEYLFIADGQWLADPQAQATAPNPFGGVNSVITIPKDHLRNGERKMPGQA
jgi:1,4-alpha-glucan branching enzyme